MDEPTDPLRRQMALTALTTEHFNLQTARAATINEANGRSTLYLGTLSSAVIAIAFIGQASELGDAFYLFALTLLPSVFLLGVFTYLRLVQTSIEDIVYAMGNLRIREYFVRLDPAAAPFFPPTDPEGIRKLERMGFLPRSGLQAFLTAASMVACINAIVGGVAGRWRSARCSTRQYWCRRSRAGRLHWRSGPCSLCTRFAASSASGPAFRSCSNGRAPAPPCMPSG
jgi:hypothetical protein